MIVPNEILLPSERAALALRDLFASRGYSRYQLSKFEEYSLYLNNREFLGNADIVAFTDTSGKLLALRPDVTLTFAKNVSKDAEGRLYYHEHVFRRAGLSKQFRELSQCGIEIYGNIVETQQAEAIALAWESLRVLGLDGAIDISHAKLTSSIFTDFSVPEIFRADIIRLLNDRNKAELNKLLTANNISAIAKRSLMFMCEQYGPAETVFKELLSVSFGPRTMDTITQVLNVIRKARHLLPSAVFNADFSLTQDVNYYSGIIFQGIASKLAEPILSGGQYDALMKKLGKNCGAIGFAVYVDKITEIEPRAVK